jgi:hypothetical protein
MFVNRQYLLEYTMEMVDRKMNDKTHSAACYKLRNVLSEAVDSRICHSPFSLCRPIHRSIVWIVSQLSKMLPKYDGVVDCIVFC